MTLREMGRMTVLVNVDSIDEEEGWTISVSE